MRTVNVTFSIPEHTNVLLHSLVEKRRLSHFVATVIEKALEEKQQDLRAAYIAANSDLDRTNTLSDWSELESEDWDG